MRGGSLARVGGLLTPSRGGGSVAFVATYANPAGGGWLIVVPATVAVGDDMFVFGSLLQSAAFTMTPPAGWTAIGSSVLGTGGTYGALLQAWHRVATLADVGGSATHEWTSTSGVRTTGVLEVLRGQAPSGAIEAADATGSTSTSTSAVAPSVTTTTPGGVIVRAFAGVDSAGGLNAPTAPATSRQAIGHGDSYIGMAVSDEAQAVAGATGTKTATFPAASSWAAMTIAVVPAA